jgi:MFS family permease
VLGRNPLVLATILFLAAVLGRLVGALFAGALGDEAGRAIAVFLKASLATALVAVLAASVLLISIEQESQ